MDQSFIADISLPTAAAGIVVLAINTIFNRIVELRKIRNGGTEPAKTVAVLEEIRASNKEMVMLTASNGAKLEALKHIDTRIEAGVSELQTYNATAKQIEAALRQGRAEGREDAREERYKAP